MNYVGKILSNFKEFYKEINSATLTGAIDVIVVEKEDGSHVSSPFHVRFGKMGVIRAREKVVDIEVNGQPVPDIHMKLGEAGEAFFVEEVEGNEEQDEMPAYLATSPLPSSLQLMEQGLEELHKQLEAEANLVEDRVVMENETEAPSMEPLAEHRTERGADQACQTPVIGFEDPRFPDMSRKDSDQSLYMSSHNTMDTFPQNDDDYVNLESMLVREQNGELVENSEKSNKSVGSEERFVSLEIKLMEKSSQSEEKLKSGEKTKELEEVSSKLEGISEEKSEESGDKSDEKSDKSEENGAKLEEKSENGSDKVERLSRVDRGCQTDVTGEEVMRRAKSPLPWHVDVGKEVAGQLNQVNQLGTSPSASTIITPSIAINSSIQNSINSSNSTPNLGDPPKTDSRVSMDSEMSLTESRPMRKRRRKKISKRKEVLSHLKDESGSSVEDAAEEAVFTLDIDEEEPELIHISRTVSLPMIHGDRNQATEAWASHQFASSCHPFSDGDITPICSPIGSRPPSPKSDTEFEYQKYDTGAQTMLTGDDFKISDAVNWRWGEVPHTPAHDDMMSHEKAEEKPSGGLFQFMRMTKKLRHQPDQEGIYLDDLNLDQMDPEVAALYLYQKSPSQLPGGKDEDTESGRGASLPQSPVSMERESHDLVRPEARRPDVMPEIAMSLCGGLRQPEMTVPQDKFLQHMITYDQLCSQPNLLTNPNLIIKIEDKFYNWQIAGPMVMSALAFQRPLGDGAVNSLIKQHMPKKETRKSYWMWWRTVEEEAKKDASPGTTPIQHSTSVPGTPSKTAERRRHLTNDIYSTEDESDVEKEVKGSVSEGGKKPVIVTSSDSSLISMTTMRHEKFKKTLKLTAEQLKLLKLQPGRNSITFSVTTRYQGTCMCEANIYLWKWNDKIVISDIDGTITKSDVLGQLLPVIGKDWSQAGIASLYNMISRNGYKFVYLSARAIGQAKITRDYLRWIRQGEQGLPDGPLLLSPSSLISAFHREVIERKPEEFKISCLKDITALFPSPYNPFCAGFGNKINDVWAYRAVGIPISRIFTVNHKGELRLEEQHSFQSSYTRLGDIVDHFFPPLLDAMDSTNVKLPSGNFHAPSEFSSFTYWREPLPEIEAEVLESLPKS